MKTFPRVAASAIILTAFAILSALYLTGCSHAPAPRTPVARISTVPAERSVLNVERHTRATQAAADAAFNAITAATATAATLLRATPPDLRPLVEELQTQLADAQKQAVQAASEAAQALTANALTQAELVKVSDQANAAAVSEAKVADERDAAKTEAATFREERDKARARNAWLLIALVVVVIVAAFIIIKK